MDGCLETVVGMFPHISKNAIRRDLNVSQNVEETINHILDGTLVESDEDHLPDIMAPSNYNNNNSKNSVGNANRTGIKSPIPVHCISDESDDDDIPLNSVLSNFSRQSSAIKSDPPSRSDSPTSSDYLPDLASRMGTLNSANYSTESSHDHHIDCKRKNSERREDLSANENSCASGSSYSVPFVMDEPLIKKSEVDNVRKKDIQEQKKLEREKEMERKRTEKVQKLLEKEERKRIQEEKKREQEREKQRKRFLAENRKAAKPGECLKFISVTVDLSIMNKEVGPAILTQLQGQGIRYEIQEQPQAGIITFWREVTQVKDMPCGKLQTETKEVVEDEILLYASADEFVAMVNAYLQEKQGLYPDTTPLRQWVMQTKEKLENRNVTLIVQGMEKYYRDQKTQNQRAYRQKVTGEEPKKKSKKIANSTNVTRIQVEEALVDVQLHADCNIKFWESNQEVAKCVLGYTKSVAEAPFKRERLTGGFTFHIDGTGSVKVDKEGNGLSRVWRQQIQQFKSVTAEVANAIMAEYSSPVSLYQAYQKCSTEKEAELLLQDIVIRRGTGVMATNRRVGKELSRRFYHLMTADDGEFVIK